MNTITNRGFFARSAQNDGKRVGPTLSRVKLPEYDSYEFTDGNYTFRAWVKEGLIILISSEWGKWLNKPIEELVDLMTSKESNFIMTKETRRC